MTRFKNTFLMGICILSICLTGNTNLSVAQNKKSPVVLTTTCICDQVPLYPVGGTLWAWLAYMYQYETDCTTATAVSIINYNELEDYPETLCKDTGNCGSECATKVSPGGKTVITEEPKPTLFLHTLPAAPTAKFELYPPEIDLNYKIVETRFLKFEKTSNPTRYAKVFFIHLSPSKNTSSNDKSVYFWYGFEVTEIPATEKPMLVPYSNVNRRATFYKKAKDGTMSEGKCKEFSLVNYGGSQFLIRFKETDSSNSDCSDCENSKAKSKKKKK